MSGRRFWRVFLLFAMVSAVCLVGTGAPVARAGPELVPNGSMTTADPADATTPFGWQRGGWGTNTRTFSSPTSGGVANSRYARVVVSNHANGDAKWWFAPVGVTAGVAHTYRDSYRSTATTLLVAEVHSTTGNVSWVWLRNLPAAATWTVATASFTPPAGTARATVYHLLATNGTLDLDDVSFAAGTSPTPTTTPTTTATTSTTITTTTTTPPTTVPPGSGGMIANPSVETPNPANPGLPQSWDQGGWGTNARSFTYATGGAHTGSRFLRVTLTSRTSGDAKWHFPHVAVRGGTSYTFEDWYRSNVTTQLVAEIETTGGQTVYLGANVAAATAWTRAAWTFTTPADAASLTVFHIIQSVGSLDTDTTSLVPSGSAPPTTTTTTTTTAPWDRPVVYLTFDDGPGADVTPAMLAVLAKYPGVEVTFFAVGRNVREFPWAAAEIIADGHAIGIHSDTHADFTTLTPSGITREVQQAGDSIAAATGVSPRCVRPPYGYVNSTVTATLTGLGKAIVLWTDDTDDWRSDTTSVQMIVDALDGVGDGSIVLMHDWAPNTLVAVDQWLAANWTRYEFRSLPQC